MSENEKPVSPALPTAAQVPEELRGLRRWCGWRAVWDKSKEKWRKPPCSPLTGERVGPVSKNADHFLTFDEALAGVVKNSLDGIGFVFVKEDGYLGIDFDDCRDADGINSEVLNWLKWFPTYQEVSPSGTGVHAIGRGKIVRALTATPLGKGSPVKVEAYAWDRYFTFTGQSLGELSVGDCQAGLDKLLAHLGPGKADLPREPDTGEGYSLSRMSVLRIHEDNLKALRAAKMGEGNALLNTAAFFAGRAFAAAALEGTEELIKRELLEIVTREWAKPHPEDGAKQTIASGWQSGTTQPITLREDDTPQMEELLEDFNSKFFLVKNFGNKARVCSLELNRIAKGESYFLAAQSVNDFKIGYMNQVVQSGLTDTGEPKYEDKATAWLKHRFRREYQKVVFEPNHQTPADVYNLWRGFAYTPRKGDCSLYLTHARDNICQGDPVKYEYLLGWMAYAVRHPQEQGHVAIVIQGLKGVGKNVFSEGFSSLWGQHSLIVSDQSRVTKNFNAHLRDKCVLICDEAFFAGDRRHEGTLKALITGSTLTIEAKGVDAETCPNLLHIIIIGNDSWLVPASYEERRFLMLSCGAKQQQNQKYFQAINDQLNAGGYEALLHHLLHEVNLSRFNVREAPHTSELREQMGESLRGAEAAWFECLYHGVIPGQVKKDGSAELRTDTLIYWARKKERVWSNIKPQHVETLLGINPRGEKMGFGFNRAEPLAKSERQRFWVIPPLSEARKVWDERRYKQRWPADGGEWDSLAEEAIKF